MIFLIMSLWILICSSFLVLVILVEDKTLATAPSLRK